MLSTASSTLRRFSSLTESKLFRTLETVAVETPARLAISFTDALDFLQNDCFYRELGITAFLYRGLLSGNRKSIRWRSSTWSRQAPKAANRGESRSFPPRRTSRWWLWRNKDNGFCAHVVMEKPACGFVRIPFFTTSFSFAQNASRRSWSTYSNFI